MGVVSAIRTLEELVAAARATGLAEKASAPRAISEWLTAEEAAAYLGLPSRKALYQAIRRGQVPVHRLGRRMRFHRPELERIFSTRVA